MLDKLSSTAYGIIAFAVIVVIGIVIILNIGAGVSNCPTTYSTYNTTNGLCTNASGSTVNPSTATVNANYFNTQLSSTGLAGYTPAVIAISIGVLFLSYFGFKGRSY